MHRTYPRSLCHHQPAGEIPRSKDWIALRGFLRLQRDPTTPRRRIPMEQSPRMLRRTGRQCCSRRAGKVLEACMNGQPIRVEQTFECEGNRITLVQRKQARRDGLRHVVPAEGGSNGQWVTVSRKFLASAPQQDEHGVTFQRQKRCSSPQGFGEYCQSLARQQRQWEPTFNCQPMRQIEAHPPVHLQVQGSLGCGLVGG